MDTGTSESSQQAERGASAVEYGLLVVGVAASMAASAFLFGGSVVSLFADTCAVVMTQVGGSC